METKTYKAIVETEIVSSADNKHTYEVVKRLKDNKGEKAVIVLLYPTRKKENIDSEDSTLNHLVCHMRDMGLSEMKIINLFSTVVEGRLSAKGLAVDTENLQYIDCLMKEKSFSDSKFVIAWGTSMQTCYACQKAKAEILCMYRKYYPKGKVYQISTSDDKINVDFPHPLFLGIRGSRTKWHLEEVKIKPSKLKCEEKANASLPRN